MNVLLPFINILNGGPKAIRTEGSNGHREMAAAFYCSILSC